MIEHKHTVTSVKVVFCDDERIVMWQECDTCGTTRSSDGSWGEWAGTSGK